MTTTAKDTTTCTIAPWETHGFFSVPTTTCVGWLTLKERKRDTRNVWLILKVPRRPVFAASSNEQNQTYAKNSGKKRYKGPSLGREILLQNCELRMLLRRVLKLGNHEKHAENGSRKMGVSLR